MNTSAAFPAGVFYDFHKRRNGGEIMGTIAQSMEQLIGHTPLLELTHFESAYGLCAKVYAKMESSNSTGSIKDRAALSMIDDAEERGILKPDTVIIEPTSGNTGIGLAAIGAVRGYRVIIVMPDTIPGTDNGSITRRSVCQKFAPRSRAAFMVLSSIFTRAL